jgi:hypothetical protein
MEHFVGIDVAKDRLDVHLRPSAQSFTVAPTAKAWCNSWSACRIWRPGWL